MIRRGKEVASAAGGDLFRNNLGALAPVLAADADNSILRSERFANKTGIRISLADSQAKLPGCASGVGAAPVAVQCGIRLDGNVTGTVIAGNSDPLAGDPIIPNRARGYQPKSMRSVVGGAFNYTATRVNGERLYNPGRQVWIKVETVQTNPVTQAIITADITEDILSLGVSEEIPAAITVTSPANYNAAFTHENNGTATAPSANITATTVQTATTFPDSRSIIKIQTFTISGPAIPVGPTPYLLSYTPATGPTLNVVRRYLTATGIVGGCTGTCTPDKPFVPNANNEHLAHLKQVTLTGAAVSPALSAIVPFPIEMFDTREGTFYDNIANTPAAPNVSRNGVMSMINIDIANLRRFLRGDFDQLFPNSSVVGNALYTPFAATAAAGGVGLRSGNIPDNGGWVVYLSDRRGDSDFDGKYAMEDIYATTASGGNDGTMQPGEDLDPIGDPGRGTLQAKYLNNAMTACVAPAVFPDCEASKFADTFTADRAAVGDHPYFRRGIRLINGTTVPGRYDSATPANTRGFTVASENGIYVQGNYNSTGASAPPASGNTPYDQYFPLNTPTHIPASIVADGVTILSNGWNDAQSFSSPYNQANRVATSTTIRFAMISGDTISTKGDNTVVSQGSSVNGWKENGGVHNFKRFLEVWSGVRLDYSGSLINLFNSHNNNGSFKCCNTVYNPPVRNWVFDSTFLDPGRLPPGTPFFQYIQTTGFQRTNN
ncbi:MAG: hypothetical protein HOP17_14565 [Acidobacteria bacterium]|nr:hypothetical protein [Acidobacteriota bacterium]